MICPQCNNTVKDNTKFCIFCGLPLMNIQAEVTTREPVGERAPFEETVSEYIPPVEPVNEYIPPVEPVNEYVPPVETFDGYAPAVEYATEAAAPKKKSGIILPIVLGVLLLGAIVFAVLMMLQKNDSEAELAAVNRELETAKNELDMVKEDSLENEDYYSELDEYYEAFEEVAYFARQSNCGFASEKFHVNQGIVILDPDDTRKAITLTTAFDDVVTVSTDSYGYGAEVSFDENWSGNDITIFVDRTAYDMEDGEVGITTVTFTNDLNSQTFDVLIITLG